MIFFYLPIGDPVAKETKTWQQAGIVGWSKIKNQVGYKVILVGPGHLQGLPFVDETVFIDEKKTEYHNDKTDAVMRDCQETMDKFSPEPLLFLFAVGRTNKIIIANLLEKGGIDKIHTFVDVGSSLDGFAGKHSHD